ncbi:MAG: YciE/YciF ferroxidase family protein [Gaiellaceae bacterium]
MGELDGIWRVERRGGLLPPLRGVSKRISGERGETRISGLPGASFRVEGLSLHYEGPLEGFVDELERRDGGYEGRATFRGRSFGRFALRRLATEAETPAASKAHERLISRIDEAYAMEQGVRRMLESGIRASSDPETIELLGKHRLETLQHAARLEARLAAYGREPSLGRELAGAVGAMARMPLDLLRGAGRDVRDAFAMEHFEIASYELLERVARLAGDEETAAVARENLADEQAMARRIAETWDKAAWSLREDARSEGTSAPPPPA